ncbi:circularly permuted type 2 ATP-grasp protein [Acuticoccus mangrovi]|nr:circularly permuted type 2 ATP-grasp protein [Acuticoccus mangrovi]
MQGRPAIVDPVARLLAGYRPISGVPDELFGADGEVRPVWSTLIEAIANMSPEELAAGQARGDQYLRDAGVFYRQYGPQDAAERDWPLSHLPVLIAEDEWHEIADGLIQRADLLERVVADLYGDNSLVADGYLPPALVADNPEWLRPLVGVTPRGGHFLHFVAFDIGRGPHGEWWVLGDRTQAPSGAGFALENRIATSRVYADHLSQSKVHRLAGFFRTFRDALIGMREHEDGRVGILTPGPMNDTYFEHAYIARYLGFMLLEGDDLTVRDGQLMVRTVDGLSPVSVLWRRLDSAWADPLELDETSALGTPGMLGAIRSGSVTMVNALGSGVLETRGLLAFLPRICAEVTGAPLKLPNIATWWCGQASERAYVKANAQRMTIGSAYATRHLFDLDEVSAVAGAFTRPLDMTVEDWIEARAGQLVAQEAVTLSTTPAFEEGTLVPRPMSLRVFLARTRDGWQVMPGGFARIGRTAGSAKLAMQQGGSAADVWVVSPHDVPAETMLATASTPYLRQQPGVLPSRAADNLFWLGRYVERAENLVRLLRAYHLRLAEAPKEASPLVAHLETYLAELGADPIDGLPEGLVDTLASASTAADNIRDRFSVDGWMALDDLSKTVRKMMRTARPGDDTALAMGILLRKISGFSGLVHENMYRFMGWRFLSCGRSLERALSLTALLATFADPAAPDGSLDLAVEVADSHMTHRRRYAVATNRATVVDLLALDPLNPRAVIYQLNEIAEHISVLPGSELHRQLSPLQRAVLQARTDLAVETPETLTSATLTRLGDEIASLSGHIASTYLR